MFSTSEDPRTPRNNRSSIHQAGPEQVDAIISIMRSKMKKVKKLQVGKNDGFTAYDNALMQVEEVQLGKKTKLVRKIYVLTGPYKVGWVVDIDVNCCMICLHRWSWTRFRHHCRACGKLVCSKCSPFTTRLPNFDEEDGSRVCVECFGLKPSTESIVESSGGAVLSSPLAPGDTMSTKAHGLVRRQDGTIAQKSTGRPSRKALMSRHAQQLMAEFRDDPAEVLERLEEEQRIQFAAEQLPKNKEAYRTMRCCIPAQITRTNYSSLRDEFEKADLSEDLADRIWNTKILWLICMHPDDLQKVHIADLRTKYAFTGLDLVEMRSIAYILPKQWDSTRESRRQALLVAGHGIENTSVNNLEELETQQVAADSANNLAQKRQWKTAFNAKLEELIRKEEIGTLLPGEARNPVYEEMEWRELQVFDPDVPIRPIFYRGASFKSEAVYDTPPPPGSTLSVIQRPGQGTPPVQEESNDLEGFSILSPRDGKNKEEDSEYHGRCFEEGTLLSPKTPEYANTAAFGSDLQFDSPSSRLDIDDDGGDVEEWDMNIGDDLVSSPTAASDCEQAVRTPTISSTVKASEAGDMLSPWTDRKIEAAMHKIEAEERAQQVSEGESEPAVEAEAVEEPEMDLAQIEAAMRQIEQDEARQREMEREMEEEIARSRLARERAQEEVMQRAAGTFHAEVDKAANASSQRTPAEMTPLRAEASKPTTEDSPVEFDVSVVPGGTAVTGSLTPTFSSPNTSTESEHVEAVPSTVDRQRELEAEMEAEMERVRAEEKKRKEEILRKARDVHKEEMGKAVRRASSNSIKPSLKSEIKFSAFDDFSVTPTREGDDSEYSTPIAERLF